MVNLCRNKRSPEEIRRIDIIVCSKEQYMETAPNQLVVDYIASMTDDYFVDLYHEMFPKGKYDVKYIGYFDED